MSLVHCLVRLPPLLTGIIGVMAWYGAFLTDKTAHGWGTFLRLN